MGYLQNKALRISLEFVTTTLEQATKMYISYFGFYENMLNLGSEVDGAAFNRISLKCERV